MNRAALLALALFTAVAVAAGLWLVPEDARTGPGEGLVSLHPSLSETIVAIGAADALVARSDYGHSPAIADLPAVGSSLNPNLEAIAGLAPAAILVEGSAGARVDQLSALAPVEVLPWLTLADTVQSIRRLGAITGRTAEADALAARFETRLDVPEPDGPTALMVLSAEPGGPVWFLRRNSLHGAALRAGGFRNAVAEDVSGPPNLSLERLIALDPDHLLFLLPPGATDEAIAATRAQLDEVTPLTAPREGRVHVLVGDYLGTGPAILDLADAIEALPR